jgi:glycosyltransferase involved in cell wall biosynthesis
MTELKVLVVGSVSQSPFIKTDVDIISQFAKVSVVDIIGSLNKNKKVYQYLSLIKTILFGILPKSIMNDVIYVWFADVPAFVCLLCARLFKKKLIVVIGGYEVCNMPEINYGLQKEDNLRSKISRYVMKHADCCIVPSSSYALRTAGWKEYVSLDKLFVIPTCIKIKYPDEIYKENSIVMVGSATSRDYLLKGIPMYNEIAGKVGAHCYLIGDYDEDIKSKYSRIIYLGRKNHDDVIKIMSQSKIYCQLSYTESFGVSILEAMSVGCIPVVTNVDNLGDIVYTGSVVSLCTNNIDVMIEQINRTFLPLNYSIYSDTLINDARTDILEICRIRKYGLKSLMGVT